MPNLLSSSFHLHYSNFHPRPALGAGDGAKVGDSVGGMQNCSAWLRHRPPGTQKKLSSQLLRKPPQSFWQHLHHRHVPGMPKPSPNNKATVINNAPDTPVANCIRTGCSRLANLRVRIIYSEKHVAAPTGYRAAIPTSSNAGRMIIIAPIKPQLIALNRRQ